MTEEARKKAVKAAAANATLPRRFGIWQALEDLLSGTETHSGRLEIDRRTDSSGSSPVVILHSRRGLTKAVTTRPMLVLDATMPIDIVHHYLPRLRMLADLQ